MQSVQLVKYHCLRQEGSRIQALKLKMNNDRWINEQTNGGMNGGRDGSMEGRAGGKVGRREGGRDRWVDEFDERMNWWVGGGRWLNK